MYIYMVFSGFQTPGQYALDVTLNTTATTTTTTTEGRTRDLGSPDRESLGVRATEVKTKSDAKSFSQKEASDHRCAGARWRENEKKKYIWSDEGYKGSCRSQRCKPKKKNPEKREKNYYWLKIFFYSPYFIFSFSHKSKIIYTYKLIIKHYYIS